MHGASCGAMDPHDKIVMKLVPDPTLCGFFLQCREGPGWPWMVTKRIPYFVQTVPSDGQTGCDSHAFGTA